MNRIDQALSIEWFNFIYRGQLTNSSEPSRRRFSRSVASCDVNVDNVLTRTVAHDQAEIFDVSLSLNFTFTFKFLKVLFKVLL